VCSIGAAGLGLTITAASTCLFVELPWTYAELKQCADRLHRIGQNNTVNEYILLAEQSLDSIAYEKIIERRGIMQKSQENKEHCEYSPSAAHRWLECAQSIVLEASIEQEPSEYALEGTRFHEYIERVTSSGGDIEAVEAPDIEMIDYALMWVGLLDKIRLAGRWRTERAEIKLDIIQVRFSVLLTTYFWGVT